MNMFAFSQDFVEEVLLRVPAEELLNLKRVSKAWKATIESPSFIKRHIMKMRSSSPRLIVVESYEFNEPPQNIYSARGFLQESPAATAAKRHWQYYGSEKKMRSVNVSFFGSCNGLICLTLTDRWIWGSEKPKNLVLWNPCTNQQFELPSPPVKTEPVKYGRRQFGYGFGYDDVHDEYKVVSLAQFYEPHCSQYVEVYSLKTNSWRSLPEFPYVMSKRFTKAVFAQGSIHWWMAASGSGSGETVNPNFIVAFNLATEKYHLVSQPEEIGSMKIQQIEALDDSLFLMVSENVHWGPADVHVWVMKESWTKLCVLAQDCVCFKTVAYSPGKDRKLMALQIHHCLRRFDIEDKRFDNKISLVDESTAHKMSAMEAYFYIPSLVRLPTGVKQRIGLPTKISALARVKQRIHSLFAK